MSTIKAVKYTRKLILDVLNSFNDPAEAISRLNIGWKELSEAEVSQLEIAVEEN